MTATRHAYGEHADQWGALHLPDGPGPHPVAVVVHGGFWVAANGGADRMDELCADLVARGWAAWNVEYRRLGTGGGWPQSREDVSAAIDHLARLDAPLDLARVVSVGHSAGGHLTLLDAAERGPAGTGAVALAGTVGQAPLTDVAAAHALGGPGVEIVEAFMGGAPETTGDAYAQASPVRRLPLAVPLLLVQGGLDDLVPPAMVAEYAAAAEASGTDVTFVLREHDGHFDHLDPLTGAWATTAEWLARVPA